MYRQIDIICAVRVSVVETTAKISPFDGALQETLFYILGLGKMRNILNNQLIRFALVGVMSNGVAFVAYLLMALLMSPDVAMTVLYAIAFLISFWGNRTFTFKHTDGLVPTVFRFTAMHVLLFTIQYSTHGYFVSVLKFPHQVVQAASMIVIGILSYVISRIFVFRTVA